MEENEEKKLQEKQETVKDEVVAKAKTQAKKEDEVSSSTKKTDEKNVNTKKEENFKKVETKTKQSKHGFAKAILVLIGILVIVYLVFVIRNYFILKDIKEKASAYKNITNYTYTVKSDEVETTITKKENLTRVELNQFGEEERHAIIWSDSNTKEGVISFPEQKTATLANFSDMVANAPFVYATDIYSGIEADGKILYTWIYTDEFNGKKCYVLCYGKNDKEWIEKDTGLLVKREIDGMKTTEYTNIQTNTVKEVYKPDLTGFEIKDEASTSNE